MTLRPFVSWPDKRLRTVAEDVVEITDEIKEIWTDMVETMDAMPGVGLAAPQIGVMLRLAVVDASQERNKRILLANPEVVSASSEMNSYEEASPNLTGVSASIKRPKDVTVRYLNDKGAVVEQGFTGLEATSVQHQIDHLQGKMYFDNLGRAKRDMLVRKARKAKR